ncbi:stage 0 sporulation family protein [Ruminococcaceae bacterium OttesenSCG-928-L11]|nr:stage 0 sporulation family protein [Ruminococcaceae bacterium OttesenSCG-928-L11]
MPEIVGVRFKNAGKVYYFDPDGHQVAKYSHVIVETARGVECGEVVIANRLIGDDEFSQPLKKVLRPASEDDLEQIRKNQEKEAYALKVCAEKIKKHKLDMKLIGAEYTFDNNKILFYFTADGRVDFRDLVKDLASVLRTRIELRQIGVRDEAKMLGGLGICGRPFCCATFLGEFQPVSIKMAKEQGLSLNPTKISGTCGRLMCCLKYEQNAYEDLIRTTPRHGSKVKTPDGVGTVTEVALLTGMLKVAVENGNGNGQTVSSFHKSQVNLLRDKGKAPQKQDHEESGKNRKSEESPSSKKEKQA